MIEHLDIESKIIVAECNEAKIQVARYGIPPLIGEASEEDAAYVEEVFKDVRRAKAKDKITNQFHFIERSTQTKNNDNTESHAQTDPPPM